MVGVMLIINDETIAEIHDWLVRNFGEDKYKPDGHLNAEFPPTSQVRLAMPTVAGLGEEVGEVLRACVKLEQGIRGTKEEWLAELAKEIGDVFVKLVDVATWHGLNPIDCIMDRWEDVRKRNWVEDKQGHGLGASNDGSN